MTGEPLATLEIKKPPFLQWHNSNQRLNKWARKDLVQAWRGQGYLAAKQAKLGPLPTPVRIVAHIRKDNNRMYDPNNLHPTTKSIVDGLVDAGIFPDDDHRHVIGPDHRFGGNPGYNAIHMTFYGKDAAA